MLQVPIACMGLMGDFKLDNWTSTSHAGATLNHRGQRPSMLQARRATGAAQDLLDLGSPGKGPP
jgi:hypothetical protein